MKGNEAKGKRHPSMKRRVSLGAPASPKEARLKAQCPQAQEDLPEPDRFALRQSRKFLRWADTMTRPPRLVRMLSRESHSLEVVNA